MRPIQRIFFCFIILNLFNSCSDQSDSKHKSALPHEVLKDSENNLTKKELEQFKKAAGKVVKQVDQNEFFGLLNQNLDFPVIWFLTPDNCQKCLEKIKELEGIQAEQKNSFAINCLFFGEKLYTDKLTNWTRTGGIVSDCFWTKSQPDFFKKMDAEWEGETSAMLISFPKEGVHLFYQQELAKEEFLAILSTLVI